MGVRDYAPGDSFRDIHWPATARTGAAPDARRPTRGRTGPGRVRECRHVRASLGGIRSRAASRRWWRPPRPLIVRALKDGHRVGLISNGSIARSGRPFRIPPSRAPRPLSLLLECLAGLTPLVKAPFAAYLLAEGAFAGVRLDAVGHHRADSAVHPGSPRSVARPLVENPVGLAGIHLRTRAHY